MSTITHHCDDCGSEITGDCCPDHPEADILSVGPYTREHSPIIVRLRKCTSHQTATGTVRLCAEHDAQLSSDAPPPAWRDALGLAQYYGVSRGHSSSQLCDACAHEALAEVGLTRADVIMQPYDDDRRLVQLIAA